MARRLAAALAVALALCGLGSQSARAQSLQRLTVDSFVLSSDSQTPQIETPFHIVVSLHVRERVGQINSIDLPILAEVELLGDERRTVTSPSGTQYRETITLVAHHTGEVTIAPATLNAIDARDGKAKEFFTNSLTLRVTGGTLQPLGSGAGFAAAALRAAVRGFLLVLGVLCAIAILVLLVRRRRPPAPEPVPVAPPAVVRPPPQRTRRDELQDALSVLRADPTRPTAVRVRAAIWRTVGANDGETLADVLQRSEAGVPQMRDVLVSLERAAFTYDADLDAAIAGARFSLERYLA